MKILLADDDTGMRELVARSLQSDGHEVSSVSDGAAAMEAVEADGASYDLLIADVDMPGHDGLAVAKKAIESKSDIGVVLISAHDSQLERSSELGGGKVATLAKPFPLDSLRATIAKLAG